MRLHRTDRAEAQTARRARGRGALLALAAVVGFAAMLAAAICATLAPSPGGLGDVAWRLVTAGCAAIAGAAVGSRS